MTYNATQPDNFFVHHIFVEHGKINEDISHPTFNFRSKEQKKLLIFFRGSKLRNFFLK